MTPLFNAFCAGVASTIALLTLIDRRPRFAGLNAALALLNLWYATGGWTWDQTSTVLLAAVWATAIYYWVRLGFFIWKHWNTY
jgi:uncharacterized membrane protein YhaH (DUF805 family)